MGATKCHGLVVNTGGKNLCSPSLEGKQVIRRETNRPGRINSRRKREREQVDGGLGRQERFLEVMFEQTPGR